MDSCWLLVAAITQWVVMHALCAGRDRPVCYH